MTVLNRLMPEETTSTRSRSNGYHEASSKPGNLALSLTPTSNRRLYNTLAMLGYLVGIVAPGSGWKAELVRLMANGLPPTPTPGAMGFPKEWGRQPFWK
jgi:hypothetical protein